jgi:hypothetical protein
MAGREWGGVVASIDPPGRISVILHQKSCGRIQAQGKFMKDVGILLLVMLLLNGCSTTTTPVQTAAGGTWESQMIGGAGEASGLSFITQFTVGGDGALSVTNLQFLTQGDCFPITGGTESGSLMVSANSDGLVTGTFMFVVAAGGNTLTLNSTSVTGTLSGSTLSGGSIIGTWTLVGDMGCNGSGTFTMTQSA